MILRRIQPAERRKEAGYYQATWIVNVPSGIYFYRLEAGEFVDTKKMLPLRRPFRQLGS